MLFGRRKGGFVREEEDPEITNEINEDELKAREEELLKQEEGTTEETLEEKQDLMDFLGDLDEDEVEDIKKQIEEEEAAEAERLKEIPKEVLFADFLRKRSNGALLTSMTQLKEEEEDLDELLKALEENETCKDIVTIQGDKDLYYYSNVYMSDNYANIAVLVEEKNLPKTIAEMVRWNGKTYPCATPAYYFENSPYNYTKAQIDRALSVISKSEEYSDIQELMTGNNMRYLYSTIHMSEKYARALAEGVEYGEYGYRNLT